MSTTEQTLGMTVALRAGFEQVIERVTAALQAEGFGILTQIDVQETLRKKLNVDFRPYRILGACNPALAHRALQAAPEVGLLLPCNVTVAAADGGLTEVSIVDPLGMMAIIDHPDLRAVAVEARERLARVVSALREEG